MTKLSLFDQIVSETAEISINITISNTCVPPQILDNLKKPLKKRNSAFYIIFQPMPMLAFCWHFRVGYITHNQPAHVLIVYF